MALVQSRLSGGAREAYNLLDLEECPKYEAIKKAALNSFLLTPEVYRKRFSECTRAPGLTYVEAAREKERKLLK